MNAVISGRAGLALLIEGESLMSLDVDDLETLVPRSPYDLRFLLADATDLVTLEHTDHEQTAQRLDLEHDVACALDMTLTALDSETSMELRAEAVAALDELLADSRIIDRLEFTMYAKPLPDSADLTQVPTGVNTTRATALLKRLEQSQLAILAVRRAWDALPDRVFGNEPNERETFHDAACREGFFRALALSHGDRGRVSAFLENALNNRSLRGFSSYREVLQQWCALTDGVDTPHQLKGQGHARASAAGVEFVSRSQKVESPTPRESRNRPRDIWDRFQIAAQVVIALAVAVFTVLFGLGQQKNHDANLRLARSNLELAKSQARVSLLLSLSSRDAPQRTMALSLAKYIDEGFAADVATTLAVSDSDEGVREDARVILRSLSQSEREGIKERAEKGADQYDIVNELRTRGLLKKLNEARDHVEAGGPGGVDDALKLYHNVINHLSEGTLKKLDRGLLIAAAADEKSGYVEHAARKYRALFQDYGG